MGRVKLCPDCERLFKDSYTMKKIPASPGHASYRAEPCDWCGKKCVLMDEYDVTPKKKTGNG